MDNGANGAASEDDRLEQIEDAVRDMRDDLESQRGRHDAVHDAMRDAFARLDARLSDGLSAAERERRVTAAHWDALAEHTRVRERADAEWRQQVSDDIARVVLRLDGIASRLDQAEGNIRVVMRAALLGGGGGAAIAHVVSSLWHMFGG